MKFLKSFFCTAVINSTNLHILGTLPLAFKMLKLTYLMPKEAIYRDVLVNENAFLARGIPDRPILSYIMEQKSQEFLTMSQPKFLCKIQ